MKPRIDRTNLNPITVKAGLPVSLDVKIFGEPPAKVEWIFADKPVEPSENLRIDNVDYNTKFFIMRSKRPLSGKYTIVARNECGEDRAEVEITVLGKPRAPKGPLEVSDITKNGCKLKWQKPEDDGGAPIDHYEIEKLDPLTGQWVPCGRATGTEANITGLQEGKPYKFRVRAVNKEGDSEPLETEGTIIAKNPFDEPGKPGRPQPTDWDKDFVDLEWQPPKSDGGAPIEKYIIQMRDKSGRTWEDAGTVPGTKTAGKVECVEEGHEYEFRIVAVNRAGPSEPSDPSQTVIAKPRFLAPRIDRKNLQKKVMRTGQLLRIDADVTGEPAPKIVWTRGTQGLRTLSRLTIETEEHKTTFTLQKLERDDRGTYTVTATNDSGTDTVDVELEVLCKPTKPKGPLVVTDITAEGVKLKWEKPEDDGGEPIENYVIERMDAESGRWVPCGTSKTPEAEVTGLSEGHEYQFRVKAVNSEGESEPLVTEAAIIAKNPYDAADAPGKPTVKDWSRDHAALVWKAPENDGGAPITGYIVEKKQPDSGKWIKVLETKTPKCEAKVPDLVEGQKYQFRVKAVNRGGQSKPSAPSDTMTAKDRFAAPRIDRTNLKDVQLKAGQHLRLDVRVSGEPAPTKKWFLNKAHLEGRPDVSIECEDHRTKLFIAATERKHTGQLTIKAENESGHDEVTIQVTVLDRPAAPEGPLKITDVHKEGATLAWKPPLDDGGVPVEFYLVEKQDKETGRWVPAGRSKDPYVTLDNLEPDHEYKFRVSAVNAEGESEPLEAAESIVAKNPFDEPGQPGQPQPVDWDKDHVDLVWTPPKEDGGAPITGYVVEKREKGTGKWVKAIEVPVGALGECKATVPNLEENTEYEFRVRAVNAAGPGEASAASKTVVTKPRKRE